MAARVSGPAACLAALRARCNQGEAPEFVFFWNETPVPGQVTAACLSQWHAAPFVVDGRRYATAEHFMMAEKAALFGDAAIRHAVLDAPDPATAKALGRQVRGFSEAVWRRQRFAIVVRGNRAKFAQHAAAGAWLQGTAGSVLVEASPRDRIWGIGLAADDPRSRNPNLWPGQNLLGFALMAVRDEG